MLSVFGLESESETPRSMSGGVRRHAGALIFPLCMLAFCAVRGASVAAQVTSAQTAPATSATQLKMTVLRDAFVQRVHDAGYSCKLDAPRVVVEDVPSFGNYRASDNTLRTAAWGLLTPRGRAFFAQLAGPGADEAAAHALFEATVHQWIFIHKRGHWWQACKGFTTKNVAPY